MQEERPFICWVLLWLARSERDLRDKKETWTYLTNLALRRWTQALDHEEGWPPADQDRYNIIIPITEWVMISKIFILVRWEYQKPKLTKWTFNLKPYPPNLPYNTLRSHISRSRKSFIIIACFLGDCLLIKLISISLLHDSFWKSDLDQSIIFFIT